MQEQQEDSSGLLRNQNIGKPRPQENINMDGKSQETIPMHYNLIYKMATTNGRMPLIWRLNKSRNIRCSRIMGRLSIIRTKLPMHQMDIKRSEYILYLMSSIVENSKQDLWQMDTSPRSLWKQSTEELSLSET